MIASGFHMEAMAMCVQAPPESPMRNQDTIRALSESKGGIPVRRNKTRKNVQIR